MIVTVMSSAGIAVTVTVTVTATATAIVIVIVIVIAIAAVIATVTGQPLDRRRASPRPTTRPAGAGHRRVQAPRAGEPIAPVLARLAVPAAAPSVVVCHLAGVGHPLAAAHPPAAAPPLRAAACHPRPATVPAARLAAGLRLVAAPRLAAAGIAALVDRLGRVDLVPVDRRSRGRRGHPATGRLGFGSTRTTTRT